MSQIAIAPARTLGTIDPKVFGGFVEHLGRCIYGGLYEEGSVLADERGFRRDVLSLLRELRLAVLRWPGGSCLPSLSPSGLAHSLRAVTHHPSLDEILLGDCLDILPRFADGKAKVDYYPLYHMNVATDSTRQAFMAKVRAAMARF